MHPPRIIDHLLSADEHASMLAAVESPDFPWEQSAILAGEFPELDPQDNRQDVHGFYAWRNPHIVQSPHLMVIAPVLATFGPMRLIKAKLNRTRCRTRHIEYGLHVDTQRRGALTAIYYLNTNNGYTLFEDGTRVASVANRMVLFNAGLRHTGASCTDTATRLVLNLNLIPGSGPSAKPQR